MPYHRVPRYLRIVGRFIHATLLIIGTSIGAGFLALPLSGCNLNFKLLCHENNDKYLDFSAKIYDPNTMSKDEETNLETLECGVHTDIFPIEGMGMTYEEA